MARIILKGIAGCLRGEVFLFEEKGVCLIGRTEDCNIKITREQDIAISRRHCMLLIDPPEIKVRDLFSTNGTYVDDERLIPKVKDQSSEYDENFDRELQHGDRVSVGGIVFLLEISSELNPAQSDRGYSAGIYTTKTTKTRLIPFERATTRTGSLIPQEKLPPGARIEEEEEPSETQRLLSMPITEPIPREMFLAAVKDSEKEDSPQEAEEDNLDNIPEAIPLPKPPPEPKRKIIEVTDSEDIVHVNDPTREAQTNIINWKKDQPSSASPQPPAQEVEEPEEAQKEAQEEDNAVKVSLSQEAPPPPNAEQQAAVFEDEEEAPEVKEINGEVPAEPATPEQKEEPHIIEQLHPEKSNKEDQNKDDPDSPMGKTRGMPGWSHTDLT